MAAVRVSSTVTNDDQARVHQNWNITGENSNGDQQFAGGNEGCGNCWRSTISRCDQRFREGRLSIENDPKSGRHRTSTDDQSVERALQILEEDRRMTCEEITHYAGISRASAYRILTERLHKRRIAARWVLHDLSVKKKKCRRFEIAQFLHRFREEGNEFLKKGGCYWKLNPGFRAWIEISVQWLEKKMFPETEKIQEGPVERETKDDLRVGL